MIKADKQIQEMEDEFIRRNKMTIQEKFDMSDNLYRIAFSSGELKIDDYQENLETLIKVLKVFRDAAKTSD